MKWFRKSDGGTPSAPKNPVISFEMIKTPEGDSVRVTADWPEGANLEAYAQMLLYLQQGKLIEPIGAALSGKVRESTIKDNARIIQDLFNAEFKSKRSEEAGKPIVCPTRTTSILLKPFQH